MIPFAGARYRQETTIELADGAGLFWWETVAPGRTARGELFAYDSLQFRLDLTAQGLPLAQERVALDPMRRSLQSAARLGPYLYFANFYVCRVGLAGRRWTELVDVSIYVIDVAGGDKIPRKGGPASRALTCSSSTRSTLPRTSALRSK